MKRPAGKKGMNRSGKCSNSCVGNLWHRASFVVNECYRDVTPTTLTPSELPAHCGIDAGALHKTVFKNSLIPAGPDTRTVTGPILGWATNSNVKKGQHSLSATIIFAI